MTVAGESDIEACQLYAFKGGDSRTLVGWDAFISAPREMDVATDAVRCESVDIMGNRRPIEMRDSKATIAIGNLPMAYVFHGAKSGLTVRTRKK